MRHLGLVQVGVYSESVSGWCPLSSSEETTGSSLHGIITVMDARFRYCRMWGGGSGSI